MNKKKTPFTVGEIDSLAGLREELRLQAHLFKADMSDRWHEAEARWADIQDDIRTLRSSMDYSRAELSAAASLTAETLRETYQDLRDTLRKL